MAKSKESLSTLLGRYQGAAQDIDSIKHSLRRLHWRLDALVAFFKIDVQPDMLGETLNPSDEFMNKIIKEARGSYVGYAGTIPVANKAKKRRTKVRRKARAKK